MNSKGEIDLLALSETLRASAGIASKADIGMVSSALALNGQAIAVGDDCAAIPDGDGYLLFAIEGFINAFVEADPWFAGWCGVMVNISDIVAMGGRPVAVADAVWANGEMDAAPILEGMRAAACAFGVPIVGGHTNIRTDRRQLSVSILGRARTLLTSFDAKPGDYLIAAIDHRGRYREPFNNWEAATDAPPERLRGDLEILPEIAESGLALAAKDISQGGLIGTAIMLAECSGVGMEIDLDALPLPQGVPLERWISTFPSFGYLLSVVPENVDAVNARFAERDICSAVIGTVTTGGEVAILSGRQRAVIRDHAALPLLGMTRQEVTA